MQITSASPTRGTHYDHVVGNQAPVTALAPVPTTPELDELTAALERMGVHGAETDLGRLDGRSYLGGRLTVAPGGLGKAQFAVHAQYLLDTLDQVRVVVCLGASGGLSGDQAIGDVVVATETVEHDFSHPHILPERVPRFAGDPAYIGAIRNSDSLTKLPFKVTFGPVASGDEAILSVSRARELVEATGAVAVAWEGAGGARACQLSGVPYLEVRGISDLADEAAVDAFMENLPQTMTNLALFIRWFVDLAEPT